MPSRSGDVARTDAGRTSSEFSVHEPLGAIRVLHVDDEPEFASMAAAFLKRNDDRIEVETETNPSEALRRLDSNAIDCVVSDYEMPGKDGIELLATVREDAPDLPFILFTGKGSEEIASRAISAGVTDYLQKNGHRGQYAVLANRVKNAVRSYRREQAAEEYHHQLEAITHHSHDAIITMDAESRIRFANPAVEDHFGYTPDELEDERLTVLMPERLRERHRRGIERFVRTGEKTVDWTNVEFNGLHKDGHELPLQISYSEYTHDGEQRFIGVLRERTA